MEPLWEIQMFGRLCARHREAEVSRFRTRKSAELLAYLACFLQRTHSREALLEQLWAEIDVSAARNRLSVELNSLRRQLEPPGIPQGGVLIADRSSVRLNPEVCTTDTHAFETLIRRAEQIEAETEQIPILTEAVALYHGELLPGHYADWVLTEQERFREIHRNALRRLVRGLAHTEQWSRAVDYALQAAQADPLCEPSCRDLMTLYVRVGQPALALEHYRQLERALRENFAVSPSAPTRELAAKIGSIGAAAITLRPVSPSDSVLSPSAPAPVAASQPVFRVHLPPQFTRFFGRETEIEQIVEMLSVQTTRLLTLTGAGGGGKTRLSVAVAEHLRAQGQERIWFVPLADITEPHYLAESVQRAIGSPAGTDTDPLAAIVTFLAESPALLLLDNFEQLLHRQETGEESEDGVQFVQTLLDRAPLLQCLVTSRHPLNLQAEHEFAVVPLPTPRRPGTPERLMEFPSVQLFVNRAQARRVDFQVTASNAAAVTALCDHLEGIPLALELAAAWAKILTPAQMVQQLQSHLQFLNTSRQDFPPRHRTMRAAIEGSYRLLPPTLRAFFSQISVFRGGWTLEAAEAVCEQPNTLDSLLQLRNHSLILTEEHEDGMRFRILETLREYAAECLSERGEAEKLRDRHADYFRDWLTPMSAKLNGMEAEVAEAQHLLTAELDNLRAGMDWTVQHSEAAKTVEYGLALTRYLVKHGLYADCDLRLSLSISAARQTDDEKSLAILLNRQGLSAWDRNEYLRSQPYFQESYVLSKRIDYTLLMLVSLTNLGNIAWAQSDFEEARRIWEEGLALAVTMGQRLREAALCDDLGLLAAFRGEFAEAETYFLRSRTAFQEEGYQEGIATSLAMHAEAIWRAGNRTEAIAQMEEAHRQFTSLGIARLLAYSAIHLGYFLCQCGRLDEAELYLLSGLDAAKEMNLRSFVVQGTAALAALRAAQGQIEIAVALFREAGLATEELGDRKQIADILHGYGTLCLEQGATEVAYLPLLVAAREYESLFLMEATATWQLLHSLEDRLAPTLLARLEMSAIHCSPHKALEAMTAPLLPSLTH